MPLKYAALFCLKENGGFNIEKQDIKEFLSTAVFQKQSVIILFTTVDKPVSSAYNIVASATVAVATCFTFKNGFH